MMFTCTVEGCDGPDQRSGLCNKHYKRLWRHGDVSVVKQAIKPSKGRWITTTGYVAIKVDGVLVLEHRHLAEKALGKPLPDGAQVHHMNEDRADNHTPFNLVICPDDAYHKLLHMRARAYANRSDR